MNKIKMPFISLITILTLMCTFIGCSSNVSNKNSNTINQNNLSCVDAKSQNQPVKSSILIKRICVKSEDNNYISLLTYCSGVQLKNKNYLLSKVKENQIYNCVKMKTSNVLISTIPNSLFSSKNTTTSTNTMGK